MLDTHVPRVKKTPRTLPKQHVAKQPNEKDPLPVYPAIGSVFPDQEWG
jgi:hypothetical protein